METNAGGASRDAPPELRIVGQRHPAHAGTRQQNLCRHFAGVCMGEQGHLLAEEYRQPGQAPETILAT